MAVKEIEIDLSPAWKRYGIILLAGVALVWVGLQLTARIRGAQLAANIGDVESLKAALRDDPTRTETRTRLGIYYSYDPYLFNIGEAVGQFEKVVQLRPFDYSAWWRLGRAYEQQGDSKRAERAFLIAVGLAPNYYYSHWAYANFLLRQGEAGNSLKEFRRVAEINPQAIENICSFIWTTTGGDAGALAQFGSSLQSGEARGRMVSCLLTHDQAEKAAGLWKTLPQSEPTRIKVGQSLVASLKKAKQWPLAFSIWRELLETEVDVNPEDQTADELFWNGGFEHETTRGGFDWSIRESQAVAVSFDTFERYRGSQSLVLEFKEHEDINFNGVFHDLWVEPASHYQLQFYYKAERLPEINGIVVTLADAETPQRFRVEFDPLGNETRWTSRAVSFETPAETQVVRLRIGRRRVGKIYDYIEGKVWFDAFRLQKAENGQQWEEARIEN